MRLRRIIALFAVLSPAIVLGQSTGLFLAGSENPDARKVYIVQLQAPAAAELDAAVRAAPSTTAAPDKHRLRFDSTDARVRSYALELQTAQRHGAGWR